MTDPEKHPAPDEANVSDSKGSGELVEREYTPSEKARMANWLERVKRRPVKFKTAKDSPGTLVTVVESTEKLMHAVRRMESYGTADENLQSYLLNQVTMTFRGYVLAEGFDHARLDYYANNAMALLSGIQPRDEIEGMLAVQMIAVHNVAMETLKRAMITGQTFAGDDANVNRATKMLRTFTMQMEALKHYRTGGQQKVVVEHVHVNEGGQAIVGVVSTGGGSNDRKPE